MRFLLLLFVTLLHVNAVDTNSTLENKVITITDDSNLSSSELQDVADTIDRKEEREQVAKLSQSATKETVSEMWETLSPTPRLHDWVELSSGEWLKGTFKVLYNNEMEFDSDKLGLLKFDIDDIKQLRSKTTLTVRIQTPEDQHRSFFDILPTTVEISGILRLNTQTLRVIQGTSTTEFPREQIVSITRSRSSELQKWSGELSFSFDLRRGNTDQYDYTASSKIERRSATSRLRFDYIGTMSEVEGTQTVNNHRLNENFNLFVTRYFFISPINSEYYSDPYLNIASQFTLGTGLGYTLIENKTTEWYVSGGPGFIETSYETVEDGNDKRNQSWALQLNSMLEYELNTATDLTFDYRFTFTDEKNGHYKHHLVSKLDNDLTKWLSLNLSVIWDYLERPTRDADGIMPLQNDYRVLMGVGIEF